LWRASFSGMAAVSGQRGKLTGEQHFILLYQKTGTGSASEKKAPPKI
jgi:hypothetical protein